MNNLINYLLFRGKRAVFQKTKNYSDNYENKFIF